MTDNMTHDDSLFSIGRIRKPQGIRGEVTVEILTDEPDALLAAGRRVFAGTVDGKPMRDARGELFEMVIESSRDFKGGLMIKFDQIADRTAAEKWRQRYLLVPEDELTPLADDEVYIHELTGMRVQDTDGVHLGDVSGTYELPQGLAIEVATSKGGVLVPYRDEIIHRVDRAARVIVVDAATGLFE